MRSRLPGLRAQHAIQNYKSSRARGGFSFFFFFFFSFFFFLFSGGLHFRNLTEKPVCTRVIPQDFLRAPRPPRCLDSRCLSACAAAGGRGEAVAGEG